MRILLAILAVLLVLPIVSAHVINLAPLRVQNPELDIQAGLIKFNQTCQFSYLNSGTCTFLGTTYLVNYMDGCGATPVFVELSYGTETAKAHLDMKSVLEGTLDYQLPNGVYVSNIGSPCSVPIFNLEFAKLYDRKDLTMRIDPKASQVIFAFPDATQTYDLPSERANVARIPLPKSLTYIGTSGTFGELVVENEDIEAFTNQAIIYRNQQLSTAVGTTQYSIDILPSEADEKAHGAGITEAPELRIEGDSYVAKGAHSGKLLGIFPNSYDMTVKIELSGAVTAAERPWWAFLVF